MFITYPCTDGLCKFKKKINNINGKHSGTSVNMSIICRDLFYDYTIFPERLDLLLCWKNRINIESVHLESIS